MKVEVSASPSSPGKKKLSLKKTEVVPEEGDFSEIDFNTAKLA